MSDRLWCIITYSNSYLTYFCVLLHSQVHVWQTLVYYYTVKFMSDRILVYYYTATFMSDRLWCITTQSSSCLIDFSVLLHSQVYVWQTLVYYYTVKFMSGRLWFITQSYPCLCLTDFGVLLYSQVYVWQTLVHWCITTQLRLCLAGFGV